MALPAPSHPGLRMVFQRRDNETGNSRDLNGFRLDYIFVSRAPQDTIADVAIPHQPRTSRASDHASVVANLRIHDKGAYQIPSEPEVSEPKTDDATDDGHLSKTKAGDQRLGATVTPLESLHARFDLAPGTLQTRDLYEMAEKGIVATDDRFDQLEYIEEDGRVGVRLPRD